MAKVGKKRKYETPEELQTAIDKYFDTLSTDRSYFSINRDCVVDFVDLTTIVKHWIECNLESHSRKITWYVLALSL